MCDCFVARVACLRADENLLLSVFPIPCVTPFCIFARQKIDSLGVFDIFLCQDLTPTDSFKF